MHPGVRLALVGEGAADSAARLRESGVLEQIRSLVESVLLPPEPESPPSPAGDAARTPRGEEPALPAHVLALGARLHTLKGLSPDQRIARAWNLGIADRRACDLLDSGGHGFTAATPEPRLDPAIFVCLRGGQGAPFLTTRTGECQRRVRDHTLPGKPFLPGAVFRGLPSRAEAEAYSAGAGFRIPPTV